MISGLNVEPLGSAASARSRYAMPSAVVLMVPEFLVEDDLASGKLVQLLPGYTLPAWNLDAVSTTFRGALPNVRSFVAFLTEHLG